MERGYHGSDSEEVQGSRTPEISLARSHPAADAESTWIDDGIAELMARRDVVFQRRMRPKQGVTY